MGCDYKIKSTFTMKIGIGSEYDALKRENEELKNYKINYKKYNTWI